MRWKSGQVQIIVATKAFGMGIDRPDIQNVIRNGVPENMLQWAQELGSAGRDGHQAVATILYRGSDISHANAWILNNVTNRDRCEKILAGFSDSWKFVYAHMAGMCRRKLLLDIFQDSYAATVNDKCCDVCSAKTDGEEQTVDCKYELEILLDALDQIGCKSEVKIYS